MNSMRRWAGAAALAGLWACGFPDDVDSFGPDVTITSPNTQIVRGVALFAADVSDDSGVDKVRFLVDGTLIFEDKLAPFTTDWDTRTVADGNHTVRVDAYDLSGNSSSASRSVLVSNAPPN